VANDEVELIATHYRQVRFWLTVEGSDCAWEPAAPPGLKPSCKAPVVEPDNDYIVQRSTWQFLNNPAVQKLNGCIFIQNPRLDELAVRFDRKAMDWQRGHARRVASQRSGAAISRLLVGLDPYSPIVHQTRAIRENR
jgi:hypothetical protein